jgi:hypothetical protein
LIGATGAAAKAGGIFAEAVASEIAVSANKISATLGKCGKKQDGAAADMVTTAFSWKVECKTVKMKKPNTLNGEKLAGFFLNGKLAGGDFDVKEVLTLTRYSDAACATPEAVTYPQISTDDAKKCQGMRFKAGSNDNCKDATTAASACAYTQQGGWNDLKVEAAKGKDKVKLKEFKAAWDKLVKSAPIDLGFFNYGPSTMLAADKKKTTDTITHFGYDSTKVGSVRFTLQNKTDTGCKDLFTALEPYMKAAAAAFARRSFAAVAGATLLGIFVLAA